MALRDEKIPIELPAPIAKEAAGRTASTRFDEAISRLARQSVAKSRVRSSSDAAASKQKEALENHRDNPG
jgi:hypothetical protein